MKLVVIVWHTSDGKMEASPHLKVARDTRCQEYQFTSVFDLVKDAFILLPSTR